ncbi:MAG: helix-turn-helix domain-containing protein [Marinifilaceae bacterium]
MLRICFLFLISFFVCNLFAQDIPEDKYALQTKKVITFYDEFVYTIAEKDTITASKLFQSLYSSLDEYPYKHVVRLMYRGVYNEELGRYEKSLKNYLIALKILKKSEENNKSKLTLFIYTSLNISNIYADNGDIDTGMSYLLNAIDKAHLIKDNNALTYLYGSLVAFYNKEDDFSTDAIKYLYKAYHYSDSILDLNENLRIKLRLLHILFNAGRYNEAKQKLSLINDECSSLKTITDDGFYYLLNLKIATHYRDSVQMKNYISKIEKNNYCYEVKCLLNLHKARLASYKGDSKRAIEYYQNVKVFYVENKDWLSLSDLYFFIAKEYININSNKSANAALDKMRIFSDSLNVQKSKRRVAIANSRYKFHKIEHRLNLLYMKSKRKTRIIYIFCFLLFIVLLFILRLGMLHWRIRQNYRMLVKKNKELALEEIKVLDEKLEINDDLLRAIVDLIECQKIYLESDIKLASLAERLNSNTSYVSEVINKHYKKNFSTLINEYRIKEVLIKIENEDIKKYTIESLGNEVGFKSKTTFYSAFKLYTGLTPSYYIKAVVRHNN